MGKFEVLLLLIGIGALAFFSQMPMGSRSSVIPPPTGATWTDEIHGFPIVAQFSADAFKIVDGDSIRIRTSGGGELDLRLASIDAPELNQAAGHLAKQHLQSLTLGRAASFFQTDTDRYKRPVVFMFVAAEDRYGETVVAIEVNAQMVADGFAWHAIKHSTDPQLKQLQTQAMQRRVGLWANANPVPPWEFRSRQ